MPVMIKGNTAINTFGASAPLHAAGAANVILRAASSREASSKWAFGVRDAASISAMMMREASAR